MNKHSETEIKCFVNCRWVIYIDGLYRPSSIVTIETGVFLSHEARVIHTVDVANKSQFGVCLVNYYVISWVLMENKSKGEVPVHTVKAYKGNRDIAPLILNLGARWGRVVSITPLLLWPGKEPRYPLVSRLDGPQNRSGCFGEKKNILPPPDSKPGLSSP